MTGHTPELYTDPQPIDSNTSAIQLIVKQQGKTELKANCGVSSYDNKAIACMNPGTVENSEIVANPKYLELNSFSEGMAEIFLRFPRDNDEEIRIMKFKVEAVDTSGCMNPDATNYDPGATKDDGSCKYSKTIPYKKCVGGFIIPDPENPGEYINLPDKDNNGIPEWNPKARPYCELRTTTPEASPKAPT